MAKPYGFKIISDSKQREFLFSNRDWNILNNWESFSDLGSVFRRLIGADALEFRIGRKKYSVFVTRSKPFFLSQIYGVKSVYEAEKDDLKFDYSVLMPGYDPDPTKNKHVSYLGYLASANCFQGFATLKAYEGVEGRGTRSVAVVDLRRFADFEVDDGKRLRLRRKKRESEIWDTLQSIESFVADEVKEDVFQIELVGGDS